MSAIQIATRIAACALVLLPLSSCATWGRSPTPVEPTSIANGQFWAFDAIGSDQLVLPRPPGVTKASVSVRCGADVYIVSTGNDSGTCTTTKNGDNSVGDAECSDGSGNNASVSCIDGIGGCDGANGSGSCSIETN